VRAVRKIYVLDTNVLIHDPRAIFNFVDNEVVIPISVIEEIDKLKRDPTTGVQARITSRIIDEIRKKGSLSKGVDLEDDIFFRVEIGNGSEKLPKSMKKEVVDNKILAVTLGIKEENPDKKVVIVTKDINMRIKGDALGLEVEDYETDMVSYSDLYEGNYEIEVTEEAFKTYEKTGRIKIDEVTTDKIEPNAFFKLTNGGKEALGRYSKPNKRIERMAFGNVSSWGVRGRNDEQEFAMDLLMDENIKVVTLVGRAGTGKTLLAVATGLEQVVERKKYKKLFIARPIIPMGKDIGYLPGGEKEKLKPWMQPIYDNIDFLSETKEDKAGEKVIMGLESLGLLKIEALTYIRGRSIPAGFIIIDEAQNLTPLEIKTIVTRAGKDTKIVFTGDPEQIDSPYLDSNTNGLTYLAEKFRDVDISGHMTLKKGERSELAELASKLL
jgi:PhoH-like ATPase